MSIQTNRLNLRGVTVDDAEEVFLYRSKPEVNRYLTFKPKTLEDVREFIKTRISPTINEVNTWYQFAIIKKETGKIIGDIGLNFFDADGYQMEIGYNLNNTERGKGYATEALKACMGYLFNELNKHRITACIDPSNTPSIALVERLGFRKEAYFKENFLEDGKWLDEYVYGLLKREFNAQS